MADKGKATDDDIPGAGQPRPPAAQTETTVVDDTLQAPAGPTATAAGGLQPLPDLPGAPIQFRRAGRGGGGGSGHGGFSQSAPMMMLQQPLGNQGSPRAAPTAGAGDTAARVSSATVTAVGPPDASSLTWHGGLAPPLGNPALGRGGASGSGLGGFCPPTPTILANPVPAYTGEPSTRHAPAAYATRPPFLPALGHGGGGNPVTIQSLASRQQGNAIGQLEPHRGQSSSVAQEQQSSSSASVADRCFQCNKQIQRALVVDDSGSWESYFCKVCWQKGNMPSSPPVESSAGEPQGQEAVPDIPGNPVTIQSLVTASRRRFLARRQQGNASAPQGHRGQSSSVAPEQQSSSGGVYVDRAALEQHEAIRAKLDEDLKTVAIVTKDKDFSISRRCETCGRRECTVRHRGGPPPPPPGGLC